MELNKFNNYSKYLFIGILVFELVAMLIMSQHVGISADERRHIQQAEKVYNYFKSKGEDKAALEKTGIDPMQYNGQSFDNLLYVITKTFNFEKVMEARHFFNALIGWLIILITGLIAKRMWGYNGAILAILLLFFTPRFLGHALNNNKDIPFAFGFILSFYGILLFLDDLPKVKIRNILVLIFGIAYAISIRLAGIISIGFLGLFSIIYYFTLKPIKSPFKKSKLKILKRLFIFVPLVIVIGYILGILFWPYMINDPISHFKTVLGAMSTHPIKLNQLFNGKIYLSDSLPPNYTIIYILYTYPLSLLFGILLFISFFPINLKKNEWLSQFAIFFAFLFVVIWMSLKNSNIYGGIRHLLFIYPLAICITVIGVKFFTEKITKYQNKLVKYIPLILIIALSINPIKHILKNYPYSYIYFNELAGGTKKAAYNFETDYFQHSLKHATSWLLDNELGTANNKDSIKIVTNDAFNVNYYIKNLPTKINVEYTRYYEKYSKDWDYGIFYCDYIAPNQLKDKLWPPLGTIHTEEVDGFAIAAVVKRKSYEDFEGFDALNKNKTQEAKTHFLNLLKIYPESEEVYEGLARASLIEQDYEKAIEFADSSLKYNPRQIGSLYAKAVSFNNQKKYNKALQLAQQCIDIQEGFADAHFQKGYALARLNNPNDALKEFQLAIGYKNEFYEAFMQMGEILINFKKYKDAIQKIYNEVLNFKKNDLNAIVSTAKCYFFLGNKDKAIELLQQVPKNQQNNFNLVKLRFRLELDNGNMNNAARLLNMARRINNNSELFLLRAKYSLAINDVSRAKEFVDRAIDLDNTNNEAKDFLKMFEPVAKTQPIQNTQNQVESIIQKKGKNKNQQKVDLFDFN